MSTRFVSLLTPDYATLRNRSVYLILLAVSIFLRFPFFFRDYIDRDESTFILLGQSWANGHLPYTELWDLKPPLTFLFFKILISVFGKSFFAIRAMGAIMVAITGFFTYKIGEMVSSKKIGFWAALVCVSLQSMFGSIQGVMSEHLCMAFLMPALFLIIRYKNGFAMFLAGILMGIAPMIKLNIAYVVLFIGLYLAYTFIRRKAYAKGAFNVVLYATGILLVVASTWLPYYWEGLSELWYRSIIEAALSYAEARRDSIFTRAPYFLILTGFLFFAWKKKYLDFKDTGIQILMVALLGVVYSFYKGGRINSHYLIQLYPILIVPIAIFVSKVKLFLKFDYRPYIVILVLLLPLESYLEYMAIAKHKMKTGTFYNGEGITVPKYLLENNIPSKNILFLEYHIGYWLLDANPPTKAATHPSNLARDEMYSAYNNPRATKMEELEYIMEDIRPNVVVTRLGRSIFDPKQVKMNTYMNNALVKNYRVLDTVDLALVHQRRK